MLWSQREVARAGRHRIWPHILIRPQPPCCSPPRGEATRTAPISSNSSTQPSWKGVGGVDMLQPMGRGPGVPPPLPMLSSGPLTSGPGPSEILLNFPSLHPSFGQWRYPLTPLSGSTLTYMTIIAFGLTSSPLSADLNCDFLELLLCTCTCTRTYSHVHTRMRTRACVHTHTQDEVLKIHLAHTLTSEQSLLFSLFPKILPGISIFPTNDITNITLEFLHPVCPLCLLAQFPLAAAQVHFLSPDCRNTLGVMVGELQG